MQGTTGSTASRGIRHDCAICGGDPGGLVWQGIVLSGCLTTEDIAALMPGAITPRGVVHLFATGKLRGAKIGKHWVTTASDFIADWETLQRNSRRRRNQVRTRRAVVVEVARRG